MPAKVEESAPLPMSAMSPPATSVNEASGAAARAFGADASARWSPRSSSPWSRSSARTRSRAPRRRGRARESSPPPRHHPDENLQSASPNVPSSRNALLQGKRAVSDLCATGAAASLRGRDVPEPVPRPVSFSNGVCRTRAAKAAAAACRAGRGPARGRPGARHVPDRREEGRGAAGLRADRRSSTRASPPPTSGSTSRTFGSRRSSTSRRSTTAS